jgi:hypothetical protein
MTGKAKIPQLGGAAGLLKVVVDTGVEPVNGKSRIDLQSTSFGHLDTPPSKRTKGQGMGRFSPLPSGFLRRGKSVGYGLR